jgi:hypothetical protein
LLLRNHLHRIPDGQQLSSLFHHAMRFEQHNFVPQQLPLFIHVRHRFGSTLARIGLDARPLLEPVFRLAVEQHYARLVGAAVKGFRDQLAQVAKARRTSRLVVPDAALVGSHVPRSMLQHLPLALFANGCVLLYQQNDCADRQL